MPPPKKKPVARKPKAASKPKAARKPAVKKFAAIDSGKPGVSKKSFMAAFRKLRKLGVESVL